MASGRTEAGPLGRWLIAAGQGLGAQMLRSTLAGVARYAGEASGPPPAYRACSWDLQGHLTGLGLLNFPQYHIVVCWKERI